MAIGTNATIVFWGTQDQIDDGTTATVANNAMSEASSAWTNDDDSPFAQFVLECQFDTTFPTVGSIDLYCRPLNVQSANDLLAPTTSNLVFYVGSFPIPFAGIAADNNFFTVIPKAELPGFQTEQVYEFYFHNNASGQTIGVDWNLWVCPFTYGPHP